jgi:hypothetical protein
MADANNIERAKHLASLNRAKHGDPGPFLVCGLAKNTSERFETACFKCKAEVRVPEGMMVSWRNTGAITVCEKCSGGRVGELLETF